jgi:hypothetical protein
MSTLVPESVTAQAIGLHEHAVDVSSRAVESLRKKIDAGLVRYDAWYMVLIAVILALGATLLAGMAVWCVVKKGKRFTGEWAFRNGGFYVNMECR